MFNVEADVAGGAASLTVGSIFLIATVAFLLGLAMCFVHIKTNKNANTHSQNFFITITMLPVIISSVIIFMGNNVAYAFGLMGTLSIVRFRSSFADPKDITYILMALAVGLMCGVGAIFDSILFTAIFLVIILLLHFTKFGQQKMDYRVLKIFVPEDLDFEGAFDDLLDQYTLNNVLERVRTADLGSLYELTYTIALKNGVSSKEFIDKLRCRNGNLNITLVLQKTFEYDKL